MKLYFDSSTGIVTHFPEYLMNSGMMLYFLHNWVGKLGQPGIVQSFSVWSTISGTIILEIRIYLTQIYFWSRWESKHLSSFWICILHRSVFQGMLYCCVCGNNSTNT